METTVLKQKIFKLIEALPKESLVDLLSHLEREQPKKGGLSDKRSTLVNQIIEKNAGLLKRLSE